MSNLAYKIQSKKSAYELAMQSLFDHGFEICEGGKGEGRTNTTQKVCDPTHDIQYLNHKRAYPVCLDCDPHYRERCGSCDAPRWRCSC